MEKYYFDFFNGERWIRDDIGQEIENVEDVIAEAKSSLVDVSKDIIINKHRNLFVFDVNNENRTNVYRVTLRLEEETFNMVLLSDQISDNSDYGAK